ncbi:MAG: NHLP leader peptide family RiPP precursor [Holophagales bacterium]|nr:NHLP leader peptide family RiPP precursor [Holophagales bacterium]
MKMTRGEMLDLLIKFSSQNPEYREALKRNPKGVVAEQFQMDLPEALDIQVLEETPETAYVVLPHVVQEGAELSNADRESLAGGATVKGDAKCNDAVASTVVEIQASLI